MNKYILMIAYHFPPIRGSSGLLRTVSFARYLQPLGWKPIILAPNPRAYPSASSEINEGLPEGIHVHRTFALDSARHLSLSGRYLKFTALPDRWVTWWPGAVATGLRLINHFNPKIIWSTYPIATAHLIGKTLHRVTNIPWIADFRDPMVYENWPSTGMVRKINAKIERSVIATCNKATFTTPSTVEFYKGRYPDFSLDHWTVVPNGYDETLFEGLVPKSSGSTDKRQPVTLVHSGLMEIEDRDPTPFFEAVSSLQNEGLVSPRDLKIILRATSYDEYYNQIITKLDLNTIVKLEPYLPYRDALQEMLNVDGLLLFQGPSCNRQIPAKLYEYFRTGKPIFALTDEAGDTAQVLREAGIDPVTPYDSSVVIKMRLMDFLDAIKSKKAIGISTEIAEKYSREQSAMKLVKIIEDFV